MTDSIFFHEDAYCQIELLPINNLIIKRNEIESTKSYKEENFTGEGFIIGASRAQTKYPLANLNIDSITFETLLKEDSLYYFDKVFTGYSTQRLFKPNIHGFGFENYLLYYEFNNHIITKSWIDYNLLSDTLNVYPERLQNALLKLGIAYDLILIDWNEPVTIDLKNKTTLIAYMKEVLC